MAFRSVANLIPFFLAVDGMRISRNRKPAVQNLPNEFPASAACILASGFGAKRGCQYPEPFQPVPDCANAAFDQACYTMSSAESLESYVSDVRTSTDFSTLTRSVTEAEGGGWGVSVSAGFDYLRTSQVTERSIAFFIGASGKTQAKTIKRPVSLKLTPAAKELLQQDPRQFIERHGLRYINTITYGGSFLGSATLNSLQTVNVQDVQAFAKFSVSYGLFSAKASTEFQELVSQTNSSVQLYMNAQWSGGSVQPDYSSPEGMGNMFVQWAQTRVENAVPFSLTTRNWIDSADVQAIVNNMSPEDQDLFNTPDLTRAIQTEVSRETAEITVWQSSVNRALTWRETQGNPTARSCLTELSRNITAKLIEIALLDEAAVLVIQQQWLAGDYSWFTTPVFTWMYNVCINPIRPPPAKEDLSFGDTWYLMSNGFLESADRKVRLMVQLDGNVVIYAYKGNVWEERWSTLTSNQGPLGSLKFQLDGNLVLRDRNGTTLWSTGVQPGAALVRMQNDCNLVTYTSDMVPLWASRSNVC